MFDGKLKALFERTRFKPEPGKAYLLAVEHDTSCPSVKTFDVKDCRCNPVISVSKVAGTEGGEMTPC